MAIDILLYNSRIPRLRTISDNLVENSLTIIQNHLEKYDFESEIIDDGYLEFYEGMSDEEITKPLHKITYDFFYPQEGKVVNVQELIKNENKYQIELAKYQNNQMDKYLDKIVKKIHQEKIPVVGIKVWLGESYLWSKKLTKKILEMDPEIIIIHGGPHPTMYRKYFIEDTNADLCVLSDGEDALVKILTIVKKMKKQGFKKEKIIETIKMEKIDNTAYFDNGDIIINNIVQIPLSTKTTQKISKLKDDQLKVGVVLDALGCPHNRCEFCAFPNIQKKYITSDVDKVIKEIKSFIDKGISIFRYASGSNLTIHSSAIAKEILKRKLKINYSFFNRCEANAKANYKEIVEQYKVLIESGLISVFLGVESGNDDVLSKIMNKRVTREDIIYTTKAIREASDYVGKHVYVVFSFIYPHPIKQGITLKNSKEDSFSLINEAAPDSVLTNPPVPLVGSNWFNNESYGFTYDDENNYDRELQKKLIADEFMNTEYKPNISPELWKPPKYKLDEMNASEIFRINGKFNNEIEKMGFITRMADDFFLIAKAAGYDSLESMKDFMKKTTISIISCNYEFAKEIFKKTNKTSKEMAENNLLSLNNGKNFQATL